MSKLIVGVILSAALLVSTEPLIAQSLEEIDILVQQTADEERGIAMAREQIERGELLEALATLERVLTVSPESAEARFNHAMLLCWIDDPQGGLVEFERLDEDDYKEGVLEQAITTCASATQEDEE